jgi:hypothetical protein
MAPSRPVESAQGRAKAQPKASAQKRKAAQRDDLDDFLLDDLMDEVNLPKGAKADRSGTEGAKAQGAKAQVAKAPSKGQVVEAKQKKTDLAPSAPPNAKLYLSVALGVSALLWFIPFSDWLLYPLRLLVTFFHEAGHALATFLTFGSVKSLVVNPNTSGMVTRTGGVGFIISSAGYLGTTILGASLVLLSRHAGLVPKALSALGVAAIACTVFWAGSYPTWPVAIALAVVLAPLYLMQRKAEEGDKLARLVPAWLVARRRQLQVVAGVVSAGALVYLGFTGALLTLAVGVVGGGALLWLGRRAPMNVAQFSLSFLAIQISFNALEDLRVLFGLSVSSPHVHTDAQNMARELFLPAAFWAVIWAALAVVIVGAALWRFYDLPSPAMLRAKFSKSDPEKAKKLPA